MAKIFTAIILVYIAFSTCKKKTAFQEVADHPETPDEVQILQVAKSILGDEFREAKIEKLPDGNQVFLEYGGKSGLSFRNPGTYEMETKLITAYHSWKFIRNTESRKIRTLIVSFVKPFYVKDETVRKELLEDFEVFRVKILPEEIRKLENYKMENPSLPSNLNDETEPNLLFLRKMIELWTVELNEFKRVELK